MKLYYLHLNELKNKELIEELYKGAKPNESQDERS